MRILMIEDNQRFAEMVTYLLDGLNVEVAETMAAAKARLERERYDLMLVDLGLPDSDGLGTLRALQSYRVPKVVLTGRLDLSSEAIALGCTDYVTKTTEMSELYQRIMFNVKKVERPRVRFAPHVFEQIKECIAGSREWVGAREAELTTA